MTLLTVPRRLSKLGSVEHLEPLGRTHAENTFLGVNYRILYIRIKGDDISQMAAILGQLIADYCILHKYAPKYYLKCVCKYFTSRD